MGKNCAQQVTVHVLEEGEKLSVKLDEFHFDTIQRRLEDTGLSNGEKLAVIDELLARWKNEGK